MTDLEKLKDLVENKNYLVQGIQISSGAPIRITLIHAGGIPPPADEFVTIITDDFECEEYAYRVFHNQ